MASPGATSRQTLRIVDANLNRIGEGLRLLEEIARLLLDDTALTQQLKDMRHGLVARAWPSYQRLIQARDAAGDIGIDIKAADQAKPRELHLTVAANARRVQESLRVIEELARLPEIGLDPDRFKHARFSLYTIEQELLSRLLRQDKIKRLKGLYVIIDTQALGGRGHAEVARQAVRGGARIVQLRDKVQDKRGLWPIARELRELCAAEGVLFIVNDHLDLALATDADGVHLGQDDLPIKIARQLLPMGKILGFSTHSVAEATAAQQEGADYIAAGAMYPTSSKEKARIIGLDGLRQIRKAVTIPIVAIGGISGDNAAEVMAAGASAVAVISAILQAASPEQAAREIANSIQNQNEPTD